MCLCSVFWGAWQALTMARSKLSRVLVLLAECYDKLLLATPEEARGVLALAKEAVTSNQV